MKNTSIVLSIFTMLAVVGMIVTAADVRAATAYWEGSSSGDDYNTGDNWSTGSVETDPIIDVEGATVDLTSSPSTSPESLKISSDKAPDPDNKNWQIDWSGPATMNISASYTLGSTDGGDGDLYVTDGSSAQADAVLNINNGGYVDVRRNAFWQVGVNSSSYKGVINVNSGGEVDMTRYSNWENPNARFGYDGGHGELNVADGARANFWRIEPGYGDNGYGDLNIGGDTQVRYLAMGNGDFTVEGTWDEFENSGAAGTITVGDFKALGGSDDTSKHSTLGFRFDGGGVTPINVSSSLSSGNVQFGDSESAPDVELDPGFLGDTSPYAHTWTVMTWDGTLTNNGLSFAGDVDTDKWSYNLNTTDQELTVSYIPEPSSLALLLVGAMVLFQRRRRRE